MNMPPASLFEQYRLPKEQQPDPALGKFAPANKFTYAPDGFFRTLKDEVRNYFKAQNMSHKAPWTHMAMFLLNVCAILFFLYRYTTYDTYLDAVLHGIFRALLVVQTTHAASHFSFSHYPMINRWAYRIGVMLIGLWCPKTWDLQHVVAHHVYTNEWPYDSDSAFPIKSITFNQRRFWYHKYQHIYMWFVYAFTIPLVMFNSFRELWKGRQVTFKMQYPVPGSKIEAWATSFASLGYVILPFFIMGFWRALPLVLVSNVVSSLYFSLQFVVNHEVDSIIDSAPPPPKVDWGAYQIASSLTFCPDSRLSLESSGGLNTQVEHHLFPGVHYSHYKDISVIVRKVCKQFGLKYLTAGSLRDAVAAHYQLLKNPPKSVRTTDQDRLTGERRSKAKGA
jgi:linoleoyl-CoA desaturase